MIGGQDIILPRKTTPSDDSVIIESFRRDWPDLVVDTEPRGFFVYRDPEAFTLWREHGATPENSTGSTSVLMTCRKCGSVRERTLNGLPEDGS
jgi:hypothetical protein